MRRTIYSFILMFLTVGTISAQKAITEVAKKVWKEYPKECTAIKKRVVNIWVDNLSAPLSSMRPSLIDSVEAAFIEAIPSANLVSVSRSRNGDKETLNYTLAFGARGAMSTSGPHAFISQGGKYLFSPSSHEGMAAFDNLDDKFFFSVDIIGENSVKYKDLCFSEDVSYDISALEDKLLQLQKKYHTKTKRMKLKGNDEYQCDMVATIYEIKCDGGCVFDELYDFVIDEYVMRDKGMVDVTHHAKKNSFLIETALYDATSYLEKYDRSIGIWTEKGNLMIVDIPIVVPLTIRDDKRQPQMHYLDGVLREIMGDEY